MFKHFSKDFSHEAHDGRPAAAAEQPPVAAAAQPPAAAAAQPPADADAPATMGGRIAALRRGAGLTQEQLAQRLDITFQAISKWENDLCCPDVLTLPDLADALGVTLEALFGRAVPAAPAPTLPWPDDDALHATLWQGHRLLSEQPFSAEGATLCLRLQGLAGSVYSCGDVQCNGVTGDVQAEGDVTCAGVGGSVRAGGDVRCASAVGGSVIAGGDVTCTEAGGNVQAGGDVDCRTVGGSVTANGEVRRTVVVDGASPAGGQG